MNPAASFLLAPTYFLLSRQAMAAIFFEPEQLAHEQLLLGTRAGRSAASGDAAGGGHAGGGHAGGGDASEGAAVLVVPELYRAKGLFEVAGSERMYALQAVQSTYELVEGPPWSDAQPHCQNGMARRRACGHPPPLQRGPEAHPRAQGGPPTLCLGPRGEPAPLGGQRERERLRHRRL